MSEPTGIEAQEEADAEQRVQDGNESDVLEASEPQDTRKVRWQGQAGVDYREISVDDWKKAGVDMDTDADGNERSVPVSAVRWDATNDFTVPMSQLGFLAPEQVEQFLVADGRFRIEDK